MYKGSSLNRKEVKQSLNEDLQYQEGRKNTVVTSMNQFNSFSFTFQVFYFFFLEIYCIFIHLFFEREKKSKNWGGGEG